jgi:hypothetical protein
MAKKTKYLVKFLSRAAHFEADIELADVLGISSGSGVLSSTAGPHLFDAVNPAQHPRLASRKSNDHNRRLAVRHLKSSLCASYIKDLYEDFGDYMQEVLEAAAKNGISPNRLIGSHKINVEASELLAVGNWDGIVHMVARSIFRKLEDERNTKSLIQSMDTKLGLTLDQTKLEAALPYFELRHLLVHHDGVADKDFCKRFPAFPAKAGDKISVEFNVVQAAKTAVVDLAKEFDGKVIANQVVPQADYHERPGG